MKSSRFTPTVLAVAWLLTIAIVFVLGFLAGIALKGIKPGSSQPGSAAAIEHAEVALILEQLAGGRVERLTDPETRRITDELKRALTSLVRVSDNLQRAYMAQRIAAHLTQRELVDAIAHFQSLPNGPLREDAFLAFLEQWAVVDPRSSMAYVLNDQENWERERAVNAVLRGWSHTDPRAAWRWISERNTPEQVRVNRYLAIVEYLAQHNADLATELVTATAAADFQSEAMRIIAQEELKRRPPEAALARLSELPDNETRLRTIAHVVGVWANYEPRNAASWVDRHPNPQLRSYTYPQIAREWAQTAPQAAVDWSYQLPTGSVRAAALTESITAWIESDGVLAPAQWLNQLDPHPDLDDAVQIAALAMMESAPSVALSWAHSITDASESEFTVMVVAEYWLQSDPAAALQHISTDPHILPTTRSMLLETAGAASRPASSYDAAVQPATNAPQPRSETNNPNLNLRE